MHTLLRDKEGCCLMTRADGYLQTYIGHVLVSVNPFRDCKLDPAPTFDAVRSLVQWGSTVMTL